MRKIYDKEFKKDAVKLSYSSGKKLRDLEDELGIGTGCISHWRKELQQSGEVAFPGNGNVKEENKAMVSLRKELATVKQERDILKKAISIFSRTPQ